MKVRDKLSLVRREKEQLCCLLIEKQRVNGDIPTNLPSLNLHFHVAQHVR